MGLFKGILTTLSPFNRIPDQEQQSRYNAHNGDKRVVRGHRETNVKGTWIPDEDMDSEDRRRARQGSLRGPGRQAKPPGRPVTGNSRRGPVR